jgi:hypothetical protein
MNDMIDTHDVGRRDGNGDWNGHMHRYLVLFYTDLVLVYLSRCLVWSSGFTSTSQIPLGQLNPQLPTDTHTRRHPARFVLLGFRIVTLASGIRGHFAPASGLQCFKLFLFSAVQ